MTKIGLISDTHGSLDEKIFTHLSKCDEIWHAGDFGNGHIADRLKSFKPLKGVYGNIDGADIRSIYPEKLFFQCEDIPVYMVHIGGSPPKYAKDIKKEIASKKIKLFITGHSHILKIIFDDNLDCLYMNPGAAGNQGWHKIKTLVRFTIDGSDIKDCEVIEIGIRGSGK